MEVNMGGRLGAALSAGAALVLVVATPAMAAVTGSPAPSSTAAGPVLNSVEGEGRLYIGGKFTAVDGRAKAGLAALDAATGVRVADFGADVAGTVHALATDGTNIYVAGSFTSVGGV